jgi:SAM-dependent methyltransferase
VKWRDYYRAVEGRPARPTLLRALEAWGGGAPGRAVDLGCGDGRDAIPLLERGWRVLAIDREEEAIARILARCPAGLRPRLQTRVAPFETTDFGTADLVNASYSLPFCGRDAFAGLWARITVALAPGGLFAGQLFGPRDGWAARGVLTHDSAAVTHLLAGLEPVMREEEEFDGETARGKAKHWHIVHLVARRPG